MAYLNGALAGAVAQAPPVVQQLEAVFAKLDDAPLLKALEGPTRRGPKGHPAKVLWRCFVTRYVLGLPPTKALRRQLRDNPFIAQACGINTPEAIPHHSTFSRFFAKLARAKYLPLVKDISRRMVRQSYAAIPGFGQRVALDSTTLKAWSNGGRPKKADKEAGWSVKTGTQGRQDSVFGWKLTCSWTVRRICP